MIGFWDLAGIKLDGMKMNLKKTLLNDLNIMQPVMLTYIDGHSCWVNDNAIKLSGLDSSIQIDGGDIVNGCILIDNAMNPIQESIPKSDDKMIQKWIKMATKIIISRGIFNIHDAWQTSDMIKNINFLIEKMNFLLDVMECLLAMINN